MSITTITNLQLRYIVEICGLMLVLTSVSIPFAWAQNSAKNPAPVFPADSKPYGLTYPQWAAKFYQWGLSIPLQASPFNDDTGKNCAQNQQGPVWFLGGT